MATRFYLPSTGAAEESPAFDAAWLDTAGADRLAAVVTPIDSAFATKAGPLQADPASEPGLVRQYVSAPIAAQEITGTVRGQIRGTKDFGSTTALAAVVVRVVSNDGSTVRGTLLSLTADDNNFATALQSRFAPESVALTASVEAEAGDRLVFEFGAVVTGGGNRQASIEFGDVAASDIAVGEGATNQFNPWIELSHDVTFAGGGGTPVSQTAGGSSEHLAAVESEASPPTEHLTPVAQAVTLNVEHSRGLAAGNVVFHSDDTAAEGYVVVAVRVTTGDVEGTDTTDASGAFSIALEPGEYDIYVRTSDGFEALPETRIQVT